eukprot:Pgem_evm1s17334
MKFYVAAITPLIFANLIHGNPSYPNKIPNGKGRPLGHQNGGGSAKTQFAYDFIDAGYKWSKEFCNKDSDGDGITNGEELGDKDCSWTEGQPDPESKNLTDPSVNNNDGTFGLPSTNLTPPEQERLERGCPQEFKYEGISFFNISLEKDFKIPEKETTYIFKIFDTAEVLGGEDLFHMTSSEQFNDKTEYLHHYVIYMCPSTYLPFVNWEIESLNVTDCMFLTGVQTGQKKFCAPENGVTLIDPKKFPVLALEVHFNNPSNTPNITDNSYFQIGVSPKNKASEFKIWPKAAARSPSVQNKAILEQYRKEHEEDYKNPNITEKLTLMTKEQSENYYKGGSTFEILPNTTVEHVLSFRVPKMIQSLIPPEGISLFSTSNHGHGALKKSWTTVTTNSTGDRKMANCYDEYHYLTPYQFIYPENEITIHADTILTQHCVFKNTRNTTIVDGPSTSNEMCQFFGAFHLSEGFNFPDGKKWKNFDYSKSLRFEPDKDLKCNGDVEKQLQEQFS